VSSESNGGGVCVGLMSGTSLDGISAAVARFTPEGNRFRADLLAFHVHEYAPEQRDRLKAAMQSATAREYCRLAVDFGGWLADAAVQVLAEAGVARAEVRAIGTHGQTLWHEPGHSTWQLDAPAVIAERTGLAVVSDFRVRDVAAGGQGAPLVPAFHAALFGTPATHRVIVNIGGIANITDLPPGGPVSGFDTGPGNALLDLWCGRHRGTPFDAEGSWAATGKVAPALLDALLGEPFFAAKPPKSTHRDTFNLAWLEGRLKAAGWRGEADDVQATLVALTARTIGDAIRTYAPGAQEVLACGGGANNAALMKALEAELKPRRVATTETDGVPVEHVEALAFAWLAREALAGRPGNIPAVTGAKGPRVLGAIYPR